LLIGTTQSEVASTIDSVRFLEVLDERILRGSIAVNKIDRGTGVRFVGEDGTVAKRWKGEVLFITLGSTQISDTSSAWSNIGLSTSAVIEGNLKICE
jgi:hypothetical protein